MTASAKKIPSLRHLGFVQLQVIQGDIGSNLSRLRHLLAQRNPPPHSLLVLPELWATGFAYRQLPNLQEDVARLADQLQELAERYDILLAGSLPEPIPEKDNLFFNSLEIFGRSGTFGKYRKQHIFPGEEQAFRPWTGPSVPIVTPCGVVGCLICYDLRFPGLARSQCQQGADLLLCAAEWPAVRIQHWRSLTVARAIENQIFMVACNGIGKNGQLTLGGHSLIVSPLGEILHEAGEEEEAEVVEIDWQVKIAARAGFRSFTSEPCRLSAEKIVPPELCAMAAERRNEVGQRVIYLALEGKKGFAEEIETLETTRTHCDYLIVGISLSKGQVRQDARAMLKSYAALGCVDAVFALEEMTLAVEPRLRKFCLDLPDR